MRRLLRWALGLLFVAWLLTGVSEVKPGERAVVRRFGRVLDVQPEAGLWVGLPWGLDRVDRVPIEMMRSVTVGFNPLEISDDTPAGQLLTGDRNLINVRIVVNYTIDPELVVQYVEQQDRTEELIIRAAESVLTDWVAARKVDFVWLQGKTALPLELPSLLQQTLTASRLGVVVRSVDVAYLDPPADVKPAFDRVAEAVVQSRRMEQEAREEANRKKDESDAAVNKMNLDGDAYATSRPLQARGEAAAFESRLQALRRNPMAREAGRWTHLLQMVRRLAEAGNLQPLDPALDSPLPK